jgi:predicted Zn-dependent protease
LLQARLAQFNYVSDYEKAADQGNVAFFQRLAGDSGGAKANAEQARNMLDPLYKNEPNNFSVTITLSVLDALLGEKASALKAAERTITLNKNPANRPSSEEGLAEVQTILGEKSLAISGLRRLLQTPHIGGAYYPTPITTGLLRLDPLWDPLRSDAAFQKLCEEKNP